MAIHNDTQRHAPEQDALKTAQKLADLYEEGAEVDALRKQLLRAAAVLALALLLLGGFIWQLQR